MKRRHLGGLLLAASTHILLGSAAPVQTASTGVASYAPSPFPSANTSAPLITDDDGDPHYRPTALAKFLHRLDGSRSFNLRRQDYLAKLARGPLALAALCAATAGLALAWWLVAVLCCGARSWADGYDDPEPFGKDPWTASNSAARPFLARQTAQVVVLPRRKTCTWACCGVPLVCLLALCLLGLPLAKLTWAPFVQPSKDPPQGALASLDHATHELAQSLSFFEAFVGNLTAATGALDREASAVAAAVAAVGKACAKPQTQPTLSEESALSADFSSAALQIDATLSDFLPTVGHYHELVRNYGIEYRDEILRGLTALTGGAAALTLTAVVIFRCCGRGLSPPPRSPSDGGFCSGCSCGEWCGAFLGRAAGTLAVLGLALALALVGGAANLCLTFALGAGDFCVAPTTAALTVIPTSSYNVTAYYVDCNGAPNPAAQSLAAAADDLAKLANATHTLEALACGGAVSPPLFTSSNSTCCAMAVPNLESTLENATQTLKRVNAAAACGPFKAEWEELLEPTPSDESAKGGGLCGAGLFGIARLYLDLGLASLLLWLAVVSGVRGLSALLASAEVTTHEAFFPGGAPTGNALTYPIDRDEEEDDGGQEVPRRRGRNRSTGGLELEDQLI
mmetsp:Transcript_19523/g.44292  ORF Transcript_19523/g.44292 Transcript_19523/m.44292 type:complete len:626 (+) Transcript_19523:133-2010(+)